LLHYFSAAYIFQQNLGGNDAPTALPTAFLRSAKSFILAIFPVIPFIPKFFPSG